ncbi:CDGSH iron-sulfur domain-containing protein 1, partial [Sarcoptes scabiei]
KFSLLVLLMRLFREDNSEVIALHTYCVWMRFQNERSYSSQSKMFCHNLRPYLPWICTSIALGYAAYIHWKLRKIRKSSKLNEERLNDANLKVNIDSIEKNVSKKSISYCRCWRSKKFPKCDGSHQCYNRESGDNVGPLTMIWNDFDDGGCEKQSERTSQNDDVQDDRSDTMPKLSQQFSSNNSDDSSDQDKDMDIKSIDSESPIQPNSLNETDSIEEFEQIDRNNSNNTNASNHNSNNNNSNNVNNNSNQNNSDEQLSSLEMI